MNNPVRVRITFDHQGVRWLYYHKGQTEYVEDLDNSTIFDLFDMNMVSVVLGVLSDFHVVGINIDKVLG